MEQRCFIEFCKSIYIPVASLDKDQEARLYKVTKEARSNSGHKTKRRSIWKEGVNSYFSPFGKANEGNPMQASHLFDLHPGRGLPAPLAPDRDWYRTEGSRERKQHMGILLLNASWHQIPSLWEGASQTTTLSLTQRKPFPIPIRDCLLIISMDTCIHLFIKDPEN